MSDFSIAPSTLRDGAVRFGSDLIGCRRLILLCFFIGIVCGALVGCYSPEGRFSIGPLSIGSFSLSEPGFFPILWIGGEFFLILLLSSSSYFGFAASVVAVWLCAFQSSCAAAVLYKERSFSGLLEAILRFGVPALVSAPCFLSAAILSCSASIRLLHLRFFRRSPTSETRLPQFLLLSIVSVLWNALCVAFLLPAVLPLP